MPPRGMEQHTDAGRLCPEPHRGRLSNNVRYLPYHHELAGCDVQPHLFPDPAPRFSVRRLPPGFDRLLAIYVHQLPYGHDGTSARDVASECLLAIAVVLVPANDLLQLPQERWGWLESLGSVGAHSFGRVFQSWWKADRAPKAKALERFFQGPLLFQVCETEEPARRRKADLLSPG